MTVSVQTLTTMQLRHEVAAYFSPMARPWAKAQDIPFCALKGQLNQSTNISHHKQLYIPLKT
jgi:hypothetical protein